MDATHIHLLTNHIPILGTLFGTILLIVGMALKNKSVEITALATILLAVLFTFPAYFSGEEAEHIVEKVQGISEHELEEHEEHAELSLWLMIACGLFSLITIASYRYAVHLTKIARLSTLVLSIVAFLSMIPLSLHGGKIIHSEIRTVEVEPEHSEDHH